MQPEPSHSGVPQAHAVYPILVSIAAMWGATFPLMHVALRDFAPSLAVAIRFCLAALATLPWAWRGLRQRHAMRHGLTLGLIMLVIYLIMAHALQRMTPPRVAFLLGTTVLFVQVPGLLRRGRSRFSEWAGGLGSLLGLFVLTRCGNQHLNATDCLVLTSAALSALGLVLVRRATLNVRGSADALTFYSLATIGMGAATVSLLRGETWQQAAPGSWAALLYCALLGGALAQRLQMTYQKYAADAVASMIFALKPVFAAFFSALLLGQGLDGHTWLGGAIMFAAAFLPPLWQHTARHRQADCLAD